jgi:uncharacterized protein
MATRHLIGLISDTHGLFRPEVVRALDGVELILHAGDIGSADVLVELARIAPVQAVHGNVDIMGMPGVSAVLELEVGGVSIHVSHGHELGLPRPVALVERYPADVIVFGHTHRPLVERVGRQLVVNPGAAGAARFHLVPSCGLLTIAGGDADVRIVPLV